VDFPVFFITTVWVALVVPVLTQPKSRDRGETDNPAPIPDPCSLIENGPAFVDELDVVLNVPVSVGEKVK
jgi:hypothetical protein